MKIVGCDLHTRYQQVAMLDQKTGELVERRLEHESGEARAFCDTVCTMRSFEECGRSGVRDPQTLTSFTQL